MEIKAVFLNMLNNKRKILIGLEFLKWDFIAVSIVFLLIVIQAKFSDCKYGSCYVNQCVEVDYTCENQNFDPRSGKSSANCCSKYDLVEQEPFDYIWNKFVLYGIATSLGIGAFIGIIFSQRKAGQLKIKD